MLRRAARPKKRASYEALILAPSGATGLHPSYRTPEASPLSCESILKPNFGYTEVMEPVDVSPGNKILVKTEAGGG